jgi:hypothetical protein
VLHMLCKACLWCCCTAHVHIMHVPQSPNMVSMQLPAPGGTRCFRLTLRRSRCEEGKSLPWFITCYSRGMVVAAATSETTMGGHAPLLCTTRWAQVRARCITS